MRLYTYYQFEIKVDHKPRKRSRYVIDHCWPTFKMHFNFSELGYHRVLCRCCCAQRSIFLEEACSSTGERSFCLQKTVHLLAALFTTGVERTLHPIALWLQRLTVLLLVFLHSQCGLL